MIERKTVSQCVSEDYCKGWNDAVDAMPKWISVKERLPEPFVSVLVHIPEEEPLPQVHEGYITPDGTWRSVLYVETYERVTHWMHLPEPPEGDE